MHSFLCFLNVQNNHHSCKEHHWHRIHQTGQGHGDVFQIPLGKALGDVEIIQVNKTVQSAYELQDEINECDIIAIVAPINLQQQFIKLANGKPVIMAVNDRVLIKQVDGTEDKAEFRFVKWERLIRIDIVKEDFIM